jgi:hypothetical protein
LIACSIVSLLVWTYIHHDYAKWNALGLDVFIRAQHTRFERYMNPPQWSIATLFGAVSVTAIVLSIYELTAAFLAKYFVDRT